MTTDDTQTPPPEPACPERRTLVRLNPDLTDSPLRRALTDAHLRSPFGIADGDQTENGDDTEQETPAP